MAGDGLRQRIDRMKDGDEEEVGEEGNFQTRGSDARSCGRRMLIGG